MKAKEMEKIINRLHMGSSTYRDTVSADEEKDLLDSLNRLEALEAKTPKYRLTRDIESIGAKKGDTIELRKDSYGDYYSFFMKEYNFYMSIGLISTVDPSLIEVEE